METREHQVVRRRVSRILDHVSGSDETQIISRQLLPMNCSSTLNSSIRRCDNRVLFARQGSESQACFMQQVSIKQSFGTATSLQQKPSLNCTCSSYKDPSYEHSEGPLFSRPLQAISDSPNLKDHVPIKKERPVSSTEPPKFAKPGSEMIEKKQLLCNTKGCPPDTGGVKWSPRMDVAESGRHYVVTVELPGVSIIDIRVEVDNQNLIVSGKRSAELWRLAKASENSNPIYHRREILQGSYQVVWPLPNDVNKDRVSAEFVDGFLQITLPKLREEKRKDMCQ